MNLGLAWVFEAHSQWHTFFKHFPTRDQAFKQKSLWLSVSMPADELSKVFTTENMSPYHCPLGCDAVGRIFISVVIYACMTVS